MSRTANVARTLSAADLEDSRWSPLSRRLQTDMSRVGFRPGKGSLRHESDRPRQERQNVPDQHDQGRRNHVRPDGFAEKYHIKNAHFTALGAINKGLFGWTDVENGMGQKKIELNQEAEIVSLMGSISVDNQGRSTVHGHGVVALSDGSVKGGHWWEAHVSIIADVFVTEEEGAPEPPR